MADFDPDAIKSGLTGFAKVQQLVSYTLESLKHTKTIKNQWKNIQKGLGVSTSLWGCSRRLQSGPGTENIDF